MKRIVTLLVAPALVLFAAWASGQAKPAAKAETSAKSAHPAKHVVVNSPDIAWGDAPPDFPAGAKMAVLDGDPGKTGPYTVRMKAPDGYKIPAHWHPTVEHLTIISGTFHVGTGDKLDTSKGSAMKAGAFTSMPAKMHHFAWAEGETELQVHGTGPFKITYIDPADDPRRVKK